MKPKHDRFKRRGLGSAALGAILMMIPGSGCMEPGAASREPASDPASDETTTSAASPVTPVSTPEIAAATAGAPSGPRSAKIIFRQSNPSGSFSDAGASGRREHQATRIFNPDGSILASSSDSDDWPKWISSVTVGITGANNGSSDPNCARFSTSVEANATCDLDRNGATAEVPCGAPSGYYRISEINCQDGSIPVGSGSDSDLISIRVNLNRDTSYIGAKENLLMVLEYAASALNPAPADPTRCMSSGVFNPTHPDCADMSYQLFVKHSATETLQPFLTLVPPMFSYIRTDLNAQSNGTGVTSKQIFIPIAADPDLKILQISRIRSLGLSTEFTESCSDAGGIVNGSAYCVGMVFYSMTLFRI